MGEDGRLRDQFVYHGAHTARWSGRGVQLQNLYKSDEDVSRFLDTYTRAIRVGKKIYQFQLPDGSGREHDSLRVCRCPQITNSVAGDLAQIESRVLAALSGCQTMVDAYESGLDLYKDIMSFLLKKPYDRNYESRTRERKSNHPWLRFRHGLGKIHRLRRDIWSHD